MEHGVVGLASCIFNGRKNIFSLQEGIISEDFFIGSPARQEIQDVGNAETKTPNAGAASALTIFHRYSHQPANAHTLEVCDSLGQRAIPSQLGGREWPPNQQNRSAQRLPSPQSTVSGIERFIPFRARNPCEGRHPTT